MRVRFATHIAEHSPAELLTGLELLDCLGVVGYSLRLSVDALHGVEQSRGVDRRVRNDHLHCLLLRL